MIRRGQNPVYPRQKLMARQMFRFSRRPLSPSARRMRAVQLTFVSSPILGAFFFSHTEHSSPLFCPLRTLTGIPCPGCGLTRSFLAIAQGNFAEAISYNVLGPILFTSCGAIALHLAIELYTQRRLRLPSVQGLLRNRRLQFLALLCFLGYYAVRLFLLARSGELALDFYQSPLGHLLFSSQLPSR